MPTTKMTFWKLINEYRIEIPIIQRDYAQGRNGKNIPQIRKDFLSSLKKVLTTDNSTLDIDFIYGSIEESDHTKTLIPLDGQQRLTTLFLLHWYLATKEDCAGEIKNILSKFSYRTRISSRDFCNNLVEKGVDFSNVDFQSEMICISDLIKDSPWFSLSWQKDPTVKSMLVMLDDIHKAFHNITGGFEKLKRDTNAIAPVTFRFLKLENFGLNDDLYVRMNARGKSLTDFENFKAKFNQILEEKYPPQAALSISSKFDNEWTDIFWKYKDKTYTIDTPFMRYFYFITEMLFVQSPENTEDITTNPFVYTDDGPKIDYELIKVVYQQKENIEFLIASLDFWAKIVTPPDEFISEVFVNTYTNGKVVIFDGKSDLWSRCINGNDFGIAEKIILFSLIKRCVCLDEYQITEELKDFVRVVRNLLLRVRQAKNTKYNTNLRFEYMKKQLDDISRMFIGKENVYRILASPDFSSSAFPKEAYISEIEKAKLILECTTLKEPIQKLEDNDLFRGCIDNLLDLVKENPDVDLNSEIQSIWSCNNALLVRVLLTEGDYSVTIGGSALGTRKYFGNEQEWNLILTRTGDESKVIRKVLKQVIQKFRQAPGTKPEEKLEYLIEDYLKTAKRDWRYYFVKYERMVDGNNIFAWRNEYEIRKLNGIRLNGYHINPYILAVAALVDDAEICNEEECYGINREDNPLRLKNGVILESRKEGWIVKSPRTITSKKKELFDKMELIRGNEYWLTVTAREDRVKVAVRFINSLTRV